MFKKIIEDFGPSSKIWIFQPNRLLTQNEVNFIDDNATKFNQKWNAHGANLTSAFNCNEYEVTFVVNANANQASGCSIDSLTRFIKQIQEKLNVDFFNRMIVTYKSNDEYKINHYTEIDLNNQNILILDNTVTTLKDYLNRAKPISETWIKNLI